MVGISEGKSHRIIWNGVINISIYISNIIYSILINLIRRKIDNANQYHYTYSFMFCRKNYSCTYCKNLYINSLHLSTYFLLFDGATPFNLKMTRYMQQAIYKCTIHFENKLDWNKIFWIENFAEIGVSAVTKMKVVN